MNLKVGRGRRLRTGSCGGGGIDWKEGRRGWGWICKLMGESKPVDHPTSLKAERLKELDFMSRWPRWKYHE